MNHPSEEILQRFATGTASREESRAVVAHLVKGCSLCATRLRRLIEPPRVSAPSYEEALERFDREMIDNLESTVSPAQTLRTVLGGAFRREKGEEGPKKK